MFNAIIHFNVGIEHFEENLVINLFRGILAEVLVNLLNKVILNGYLASFRIRRINGYLLFGVSPNILEPGTYLLVVIIRFIAGLSGIQLHIGGLFQP